MRDARIEEPMGNEGQRRTIRIRCRQCQRVVFLVRNNGGSVIVDELGSPWQKHGCSNSATKTIGGARSVTINQERIKIPLPPIWVRLGPIRPGSATNKTPK